MRHGWLIVAGIALGTPAQAQLTAPVKNGDQTIEVIGTRSRGRGPDVPMSDWRMAETPHVVVFSQTDEAVLSQTAHSLETLHFLLSTLFGRVDAPDPTIKVAVTMIGDAAAFEQLRLTDLRWQYGPFPKAFSKTIYYDPREEGSVIAATREGVNLVLQPSTGRPTSRNCGDDSPLWDNFPVVRATNPESPADPAEYLSQFSVNEIAVCQSAQSRLYAAFAQNYMMTYYPAAYPRWFLQGFGEIFATMVAGDDRVEYGHIPTGFGKVLDRYGDFPVAQVLDGRYLSGRGRAWTPFHAWRLVHFLYFSDVWKPRLLAYLDAMAKGADPQDAARALGDTAALQRALLTYRGRKVEGERMTFPPERSPAPTIRRLTRAEAGLIRGRLELGARIAVPDAPGAARDAALARRAAWLDRLRDNAVRFPDQVENQLLFAEAECRADHPAPCLAAADRVLARTPTDTSALVWKGTAMTRLALEAPAAERPARLTEAKRVIVQANRLDPEGILPLIAYYDHAVAAGAVPDRAVDGLAKVVLSAPAAPAGRLKLGREYVRHDLPDEARVTLLPVARGPFVTPEQPEAVALLKKAGRSR
ncbi:hypothetical protein GCM10011380_30810 [Sphingomonas metalli]|uniref:DUF4838 domain-containing protein n=1 Tax=Sphingomonas metalli TaxID=1779358 RepID=A0A916WXX8_9SPHN|nr:hypothetical protein [Sphingomonas metalli]GGB39175.1 hypothetical protein GCM10011380_30810 [Sphingomonas metalli]